ncbi:hypothetical protein NKJ93_23980 [Mesorhizobium sp. M0028]|uniref:hypothetical protein n=1 Tax=Mesorhizobium sp. M0028 TaxID=2956849 RepID=UPI00333CD750
MRHGEIHANKASVQAPPEAFDATAAATNLTPREPAPAFTLSRTGFALLLYAVGDNEAHFVGLIVLFVAAACLRIVEER